MRRLDSPGPRADSARVKTLKKIQPGSLDAAVLAWERELHGLLP